MRQMSLHAVRQKLLTAIAANPVQRPQVAAARALRQEIERDPVTRPEDAQRSHPSGQVAVANLFCGYFFALITKQAIRWM